MDPESLESEIVKIQNVIEQAGTGIPQRDRPPHDWLAQVLLCLLLRIGLLEDEIANLKETR
jgi:hypothetical protein